MSKALGSIGDYMTSEKVTLVITLSKNKNFNFSDFCFETLRVMGLIYGHGGTLPREVPQYVSCIGEGKIC